MHVVDGVHHRVWVWIIHFIELHGIPAVFAPVLPVLNNHVERKLPVAKLFECCQQFLLRVEAFAAMNIPVCPVGHQRGCSGQIAIAANHVIALRAGKDNIVDEPGVCGSQCGQVVGWAQEENGPILDLSDYADRVLAGGQSREPSLVVGGSQ